MNLEKGGPNLASRMIVQELMLSKFSLLVAFTSLPILAGKKTCPPQDQYLFKLPEKGIGPVEYCVRS